MDDWMTDAAAILCAARIGRTRLEGLPEACRPRDESEAYRVQSRVHALLREAGRGPLGGHKIGCTTAVMQEFLRIANPCAGGMLRADIRRGDTTLRFADYLHVGVECEIAALIARDLPPRERPYGIDDVVAAIDAYFPAIEIVDDRWQDYKAVDTPTLIADDFFHAACVLGAPVAKAAAGDLAAIAGLMRINGAEVGRGRGADVLGHPHNAVAWLANALAGRGAWLRAGDIVLTGSVVATKWVQLGDAVEVSLAGLGEARVRFV
ncbi:MAG TPA: fumarylacetoacetate hydrolase family protein [Methylomirabilota bacterium]|nr:fumarylacetoacetate hydrolase family protein [Methylomirabilota bacterium]